jgi:hypothetical protein
MTTGVKSFHSKAGNMVQSWIDVSSWRGILQKGRRRGPIHANPHLKSIQLCKKNTRACGITRSHGGESWFIEL